MIALILANHVYEKFGLEEEDYMKCISEGVMKGDGELLKLFSEMELGVVKLMQKLEIFPPEFKELMKQQEQMMQTTGMSPGLASLMLNQNNLGGGFGQSSNPMEMLQMQQLQNMFGEMGFQ